VGCLKIYDMSDNLKFESRTGNLSCTTDEFFGFITDIRNFEQFIPEGKLTNWQATADSCSFSVPPLSNAGIRISGKTPVSEVTYTGDALKKDDFKLVVRIAENDRNRAEIRLFLTAELNPFLRMMVEPPIKQFLETLISEMEKFEKWNVKSREN
jgi:hypothetical protein